MKLERKSLLRAAAIIGIAFLCGQYMEFVAGAGARQAAPYVDPASIAMK